MASESPENPSEPSPPAGRLTRRTLLHGAAVGGIVVAAGTIATPTAAPAAPVAPRRSEAIPGGTLDPAGVPKYVTRLPELPVMPRIGTFGHGAGDVYSIAARQFTQQLLPAGLPATRVWGYGSPSDRRTFHSPAFTVEARADRPVRVTWANELVDHKGHFLPHLFPVDPTLHWANPPGGAAGRDSRPVFRRTPGPYTGPVPLVTHLHGAHSFEESDGYPEAWYLPVARNTPAGFATVGSFYERFRGEAAARNGVPWTPGTATYQYPNDQRATALWFHDHALGMTRLNVQAGLAGFYLLRGGAHDLPPGVLPHPAPGPDDRRGTRHYEIPLMIQDRSFNTDGSLFFPPSRDFFGDAPRGGPFVPDSDVPPQWNPEWFGNVMLVNGSAWPVLPVEPRRYRFRLLNACNARTVILKIVSDPLAARPAAPALPIWQIGSDGGFLPRPVEQRQLLMSLAERTDVIVDFTGVRPGTELFLTNEGPDEAFGGGVPGTDFDPADPATTGQVLKFVVVPLASRDTSVPPARLRLPAITDLGRTDATWRVSLNEMDSMSFPDSEAPVMAAIGTVNPDGTGNPLHWDDPVTETPKAGRTQLWELTNFTGDAHPIHLHQVQFQVVNRQPFDGAARAPEPGESGFKDTVIAYPGEFTRVKARFDIPGRFVYHCHILDHEDNEMMRPIQVRP